MDVYNTSGLLGVGTTRAFELYRFGLLTGSEKNENRKTMAKIWAIVLWSLQAAFNGKVRSHGVYCNALPEPACKDLAGGLKSVLWSLKADLDHWAKAYGLTHYNSNGPCEFCTASRKGHPKGWHNYFGNHARWERGSFSASKWRQLHHPNELHFVFGFQYLSCQNFGGR